MMDSEMITFLREEIKRQLNIILPGTTQNQDVTEKGMTSDIDDLYPGMARMESRPVAQPYGVVSRAPNGTPLVNAQMGTFPGNRVIIGHRDANAPLVGQEGETIIYSKNYQFRVRNSQVEVGKDGDFEVLPVGDTLKELLSSLIDLIVAHTHAAPGTPPTNAIAFTQLKTDNLDNDKILAKDGGRF